MTSEVDFVKTNEFIQRRKLRLQQVREQSKDIAKKIRQRAKVETLRQGIDVDAQKKKQYLECQKQFVDKLQEIYVKGLEDVGKGHRNASKQLQQGFEKKVDKSKLRGKEAVAEVRRRKQELLDKKKELLDRKLLAREVANELSREKSNVVAKTLITGKESNFAADNNDPENDNIQRNILEPIEKVDMGTQLNLNEPTKGYQTDIPELLLPENETIREPVDVPEKLEIKRPNLFALSEEMPSSLRGGPVNTPQFQQMKSAVNLVSEHIQNRHLRLRETEARLNKRQDEELRNIKQTIMQTRASKSKVNGIIKDNCASTNSVDTAQKGSVTMYNHLTKDSRTMLTNDDDLVIREEHFDDDAFTKARKEDTNDNVKQKEFRNKIAERRNKVAVTKDNVDKEYRDTLAFLNSLPKDMSDKPIRNAFMDENRQQQLKEKREQKLRDEYRNVEKQCRGHHKCRHVKCCQSSSKSAINKNEDSNDDSQYTWVPVPEIPKTQSIDDVTNKHGNTVKFSNKNDHPHVKCCQSSSKSAINKNEDSNDDSQYTWVPVPDIPKTQSIDDVTNKHGNTVKFSNKNDYHEYRSSRKHSPPTKDVPIKSKVSSRYVETAIIKELGDETTDCSSITSDTTTSENFALNRRNKKDILEELEPKLTDADRIIIYKILNSKNDKKKKCSKTKLDDKVRSEKESVECENVAREKCTQKADDTNMKSKTSFDQLTEGIYKAINKNGDNLTSLQVCDPSSSDKDLQQGDGVRQCSCVRLHCQDVHSRNVPTETVTTERPVCKCQFTMNTNNAEGQTIHYPSAATSTTSLKIGEPVAPMANNGCLKVIDDVCQENGKFYVGTTGYLKDEAYEVVIQLRKKENANGINNAQEEKPKNQEEDNKNTKNTNFPTPNPTPKVDVNENAVHQVTKPHTEEPTSPLIVTSPKTTDPIPAKSPQKSKSVSQDEQTYNSVSATNPTSCKITKKATSTYTQTSSPIHKPIFMHMSSTSTAYMSPPDIIMPRFSKRDYDASYDETYDSIKESHNSMSYKNFKSCKCKHGQRRKKTTHQSEPVTNSKKLNYQVEDVFTSNNISSAGELSDACCKNSKTTTDSVYSRICCACSKTKTCHKHKKEANATKTCNHRKSMSLRDVPSKHVKYSKTNVSKRKTKTPLNPLIKEYVNKLLELNKEGMKAIEIINEECSSVPTPSSSIINDNLNLKGKSLVEKKISLEQIKNILKEKIINDLKLKDDINEAELPKSANDQVNKHSKLHTKLHKRKQLHKVKSLNISKKVSTTNECKNYLHEIQSSKSNTTSSSYKTDTSDQPNCIMSKNCNKKGEKKSTQPHKTMMGAQDQKPAYDNKITNGSVPLRCRSDIPPSSDSENTIKNKHHDKIHIPPSTTSTQTNVFVSEDNLVKVAEGKLQNMEKIADLTEKCTKRLSNLAKVLEEVRRNKSLFYSQITSSDSTSDSEAERNRKKCTEKPLSPAIIVSEIHKPSASIEEKENNMDSNTFTPLLSDIPKPVNFSSPLSETDSMTTLASSKESLNIENPHNRPKSKPPPALSRIYFKNEQEHIIPHELSTVLEVDSPMSLKVKSQSRNDINADVISNASVKSVDNINTEQGRKSALNISPPTSRMECLETDSLKATMSASKKLPKTTNLNGDSSDNSKLPMMDMNQFNEIMLKPFISIKEFTKKKKLENGDSSNLDDHLKEILTNDDLSSLHSENSLPDVIAELLKRKIINEPFKFDTASNVNTSTTSESSISLLALTNSHKDKKRTTTLHQGKKNIIETSDTLSISSNPDLENAFQKLGMGWASSTLKKTKERLALSSSSNTSSSSGPQTRSKIGSIPQSNADYILALQHINATGRSSKDGDPSKNVQQQTSLSNSMTVKEFLTNQLAKKITFLNPSSKDLTDQEFISLYETKMPEEMKKIVEHNQSGNSVGNCTSNRARTSTPVQIFRSMTYNSTSSSNTSNGLFSNADDLSSVKVTSNSIRNHSTSDKDDLTIPNYILKVTKGQSDCSKSD
ncbi:Protein KIAA1731 [Papilio xuthus]|uniref:Protein KIAA1731 n=1 Tax=Papilio xuthus TaxID=66420 RepID=A0A194PJM4_PAPXU|nr:Protein KIAA1731 [Papilio xuthus]